MAKERIVVIGGGIAGASVVEALLNRADAQALKIEILSTETHGAYDRFDLPRVLEGSASPADIVRYSPGWFEERGARLHVGKQARYVDRFRRVVHADDLAISYDKLVFATGSGAYLPSIRNLLLADGKLHHGAFTFRSCGL